MSSPLVVVGMGGADRHDTGPGHPEAPARLAAVTRGISGAGVQEAVVHLSGRPATIEELTVVHDERYLRALARFAAVGGGELDPDTRMSAGSWDTALLAAGAGLSAIEALDHGMADSAFVMARPPGHHATASQAMGFCLVNNVAVAAATLARRGERVAIIDWDVHHGNGTQAIFWDDPRVLYVSTHQWPAYPGTGAAEEIGGGGGAYGLTVNVPLPPGATGDAARQAFDEVILPSVEQFAPTWVLVSAGFDAHRGDPLADLAWSAGDFADLARTVARMAPRAGRLIAFLEGGYDVDALALSVGATVAALVDHSYQPESPTAGGPGRQAVTAVARTRARLMGGAI
ncbi:MAG TPA: histone deacetylase [Acidimicrobiales bacterium]|nr:histone deacetylase [Acidimicrobiales bacterium]